MVLIIKRIKTFKLCKDYFALFCPFKNKIMQEQDQKTKYSKSQKCYIDKYGRYYYDPKGNKCYLAKTETYEKKYDQDGISKCYYDNKGQKQYLKCEKCKLKQEDCKCEKKKDDKCEKKKEDKCEKKEDKCGKCKNKMSECACKKVKKIAKCGKCGQETEKCACKKEVEECKIDKRCLDGLIEVVDLGDYDCTSSSSEDS